MIGEFFMNVFFYSLKSTIKDIFVWYRYINGSALLFNSQIQRFFVVMSVLVVCFIIYKLYLKEKIRSTENRLRASNDSKAQIWASQISDEATNVSNICLKNAESYKSPIYSSYKSNEKMDDIIKTLANMSEIKGKIDAIANDIKSKDGFHI